MSRPRTVTVPHGLLIAIEGIDGAGKTTQASMLADRLRDLGALEVVTSKEPTGGPWGQKIRESAQTGRMTAADELEAFLNDRREHVATLIAPALHRGAVVILDRYYFSTAAYQGARGLDPAAILRQNEEFAPRPDLLVIVDISPATALVRIGARDGSGNLFENLSNLHAAREGFDGFAAPYSITRVDGAASAQAVHDVIWEAALSRLAQKIRLSAADVLADGTIPTEDKAETLRRRLVV